ncbi:mercuric transporter MerT family protein [Amphiplicatus metriothermophilus]|uniref:Mercuric transport protein MerT n=1 Tax=Amphiplicatus metriothermophilus TaxID=1519374 RepID=A0A239PRX8_9PROT|nr:mercuric transporter MerT family protein [Amphiplicatus metriothermophilus]MBB5518365.1 mercuric ion transport protein [Amphiplicatus metriothermophilus]SNT72467.1 mercuric ion transport protein [Amphiplicatus metriothermophilus]
MLEKETEIAKARAGDSKRGGWFASCGLAGALLASACCVVPLVLISLGVTGAWIGSLTAFEPYKPIFISVAVIFLIAGFWRVYFHKPEPCSEGTLCARPQSSLITKAALWVGTVLVLLALTINYWAPLFY